ncbi:MAG: substrate-binding domain-containing protein [Acidisphaera sp.]|nr:substrate-binding domain-containing protein [Acidisphaera sp.]
MRADRRLVLAALPAAAALLAAPRIARAVGAPDMAAFVEPTLAPALGLLGRQFRDRTGARVHIFSAPSIMMVREIPFTLADLAVLQIDALGVARAAGNVVAASPTVTLGSNGLVIARRGAGPTVPLAALKPDGPLGVVDAPMPDILGAASHQALDRAGWPSSQTRILGVARNADALFLLKTGGASLAVVYRTDVTADPDLSVAATLPAPDVSLSYAATLSAKPSSPLAPAFLDFLALPGSIAQLRSAGLENPPA